MEDNHLLLQPLITTTTTTNNTETETTLSTSGIVIRLITIFFIAIISIWANHEASKGFEITIEYDAHHTPSGRRFALLFVSNGKAERIVLNTTEFAQKILYPDDNLPKKPINRVTVRLSGRNLTHPVVVTTIKDKKEFLILISSSLMEETNVDKAMVSVVQQSMTRVLLWDGEDDAPKSLIDGLVEYVNIVAGFGQFSDSITGVCSESDEMCWKDKDRMRVANFLNYCQGLKSGFIGRLNQALKNPWDARMVDHALGLPAQQLCTSYHHWMRVS